MSQGHVQVVRTLYRDLLRSGKVRTQQLQRLKAVPLPELLDKLPDKTSVSKWTQDADVLFDLTSTEKWTRVTLDMYNGNLHKAIRSRFDESLDGASKDEFEKWVDKEFADVGEQIRATMKQFVPDHFSHKVDDGFEAAKLLADLNAEVSVIEDELQNGDLISE